MYEHVLIHHAFEFVVSCKTRNRCVKRYAMQWCLARGRCNMLDELGSRTREQRKRDHRYCSLQLDRLARHRDRDARVFDLVPESLAAEG